MGQPSLTVNLVPLQMGILTNIYSMFVRREAEFCSVLHGAPISFMIPGSSALALNVSKTIQIQSPTVPPALLCTCLSLKHALGVSHCARSKLECLFAHIQKPSLPARPSGRLRFFHFVIFSGML